MAGALHQFAATNRAWRTSPSEVSRLSVGASLQESHGFNREKTRVRLLRRRSCANYGVKLRMSGLFVVRVSTSGKLRSTAASIVDAPSCIFVGPVETAEKARLEALYQQARDSYYIGQPLVVDDMFDKVEMQLRWHGSKLVLKYPRCSLKRFTAYADAELDQSQMRALATVWGFLFALGLGLAVGLPTVVALCNPHGGTFSVLSDTSRTLFSVASFLVGAPVARAAVKQLQALRRGNLVALKGCCPNCGDEVYSFVTPDFSSKKVSHESECHGCQRQLVFRATLHPSKSGQPWAHGRVYLPMRANQLAPARPSP